MREYTYNAEEVKEGIQAGLWTVGVISRFSQGLFSSPREREMEARKQYHTAQADYVIQDIWELSAVISDINYRAARLAGHTLLTPGPVSHLPLRNCASAAPDESNHTSAGNSSANSR